MLRAGVAICDKIREFYSAIVVQEENRIAGNRSCKNLVYRDGFARDKQLQFTGQRVYGMYGNGWQFNDYPVARNLRQLRRCQPEGNIDEFSQRVGLARIQPDHWKILVGKRDK